MGEMDAITSAGTVTRRTFSGSPSGKATPSAAMTHCTDTPCCTASPTSLGLSHKNTPAFRRSAAVSSLRTCSSSGLRRLVMRSVITVPLPSQNIPYNIGILCECQQKIRERGTAFPYCVLKPRVPAPG